MEDVREKQQYVTLELHDAQLERMEALIERDLARQETIAKEMRGDIKVLGLKSDALDRKIDQTSEVLEQKFDAKIDALEQKVDARIDALDKKVDNLEQKFDARIDALDKKVDDKIDALEQKVDARIDALDKKVDNLEQKFDARFDALEQRVIDKIDGVMDAVAITNSRIDDIGSGKSNTIALWAIFTAIGVCAFQLIIALLK